MLALSNGSELWGAGLVLPLECCTAALAFDCHDEKNLV
jgi:hypothetical protein